MAQDVTAGQTAIGTAVSGVMAAPGEPDSRANRQQAGHAGTRAGRTVCRS